MDMLYYRVLPRDLFNEAKLLKCIGHLVLKIHDHMAPNGLRFEHDGEPFEIALIDDGHLTVTNIVFAIGDTFLLFKTAYNSKAPYPLLCEHDNIEWNVFLDSGEFDQAFVKLIEEFKKEGL